MLRFCDWVPLPEPGAPSRMMFMFAFLYRFGEKGLSLSRELGADNNLVSDYGCQNKKSHISWDSKTV